MITKEFVLSNGEELCSRKKKPDDEDPALWSQTYLEQVSANAKFREVAEAFQKIAYLHLVPQVVRGSRELIVQSPSFQAYGHGLLERMAATPERTQKAHFRRIEKALQTTVPQLTDLSIERDDRGIPDPASKI